MAKSKKLTWEEILAQYPDQWIALTDIDFSGVCCDAQVRTAVVAYSGKTEKEVLDQIPKGVHMFTLETTKRGLERAGFYD